MIQNGLNIQLAVVEDIPFIMNLLKERCEWFQKNKINQWDYYYTERYNYDYFQKIMQQNSLYVAKKENKLIGAFLLKNVDSKYWPDCLGAYYIHHFVGKVGYTGIGTYMLEFIENLAWMNQISLLRLDCVKINPKINEYWQKCGFKKRGEFQITYEGILWEKRLK